MKAGSTATMRAYSLAWIDLIANGGFNCDRLGDDKLWIWRQIILDCIQDFVDGTENDGVHRRKAISVVE